MSTPDSSGQPTETAVGSGQIPHLGDAPAPPAPSVGGASPGIALGAARIPGGPTGLGAEPPDLALFIAQFANTAFRALPLVAEPTSPSSPPVTSLSPPTGFSAPGAPGPSSGAPQASSFAAAPHAPGGPSGNPTSLPSFEGLPEVPSLSSASQPATSTPQVGTSPSALSSASPRGASPSSVGPGSVGLGGANRPNTSSSGARLPSASLPVAAQPISGPPLTAITGPSEEAAFSDASPFATDPSVEALDGLALGALGVGPDLTLPGLAVVSDSESSWGAVPYWAHSADDEGERPPLAGPAAVGVAAPQVTRGAEGAPRTRKDLFDPQAIRRQFPILNERVNGKRLVWLDNAATTQKPKAVIERLSYYYEHENSNIHRAAHTLAARATDAYESARESVRRFINAPSKSDIIFVRGATEGINLIAQSWGRRNIRSGDEIVLTELEHHANIVPWHRLCSETGARLRVVPTDSSGRLILEEYEKLLSDKTRLVAFTQVSNALGTITPAAEMTALAHRYGARVLVDGAQAVSHKAVDVQALDCDFYVFSGHKVFAPTGIGAVFGKKDVLDVMPPWQGGGNMIQDVTFERIVYQAPPARFEAGTGNIADAVGLGAALDWLSEIGLHNVERHEHELLEYGTERLLAVPGLRLVGTAPEKAGVLSFVLDGQKTEEVGGLLDQEGIAVRSGHHCAQPILRRFGLEATVRASLAPYNTFEDLDALAHALHRLQTGQVTRNGAQ